MLNRTELIAYQEAAAHAAGTEDAAGRAEKLANAREIRLHDLARTVRFWLWFGPLLALAVWALLNGLTLALLAAMRNS